MESADWSNIVPDIAYLILCNLSNFIDHLYFGAVCKNWNSIAKEYNQLSRPSRGTLPLYFVPVNECETQRRLITIPNPEISNIHVTLTNIPNKRCCGSSYGWLAFMEEDLSITLINPFKYKGNTIHLPPLQTEYTIPYDLTVAKLILAPGSTPDSYTVVAIHGGMCQLAKIRNGDTKWTYIVGTKYFTKEITLCDIVFHKGLVYAINHQCKIFSININSCPIQIRAVNLRNLPIRNIVEEQYYYSYLVESTSGDDLYVLRRRMKKGLVYLKTMLFKVLKLELHTENGIRITPVESLNGDTIFVSEFYSAAFKASNSNFDWCVPNSIFFIDNFTWNDPKVMIEDSGIYNVEDKSITELCLRDVHSRYRRNAFWVQPPFN